MSGLPDFLRKRWPALLLVASLVLNGFFVGMFVVDSLKHDRHGFSGDRLATFELRRFDDRLPPAAVDKVAGELKPLGPELEAAAEGDARYPRGNHAARRRARARPRGD